MGMGTPGPCPRAMLAARPGPPHTDGMAGRGECLGRLGKASEGRGAGRGGAAGLIARAGARARDLRLLDTHAARISSLEKLRYIATALPCYSAMPLYWFHAKTKVPEGLVGADHGVGARGGRCPDRRGAGEPEPLRVGPCGDACGTGGGRGFAARSHAASEGPGARSPPRQERCREAARTGQARTGTARPGASQAVLLQPPGQAHGRRWCGECDAMVKPGGALPPGHVPPWAKDGKR